MMARRFAGRSQFNPYGPDLRKEAVLVQGVGGSAAHHPGSSSACSVARPEGKPSVFGTGFAGVLGEPVMSRVCYLLFLDGFARLFGADA